MTQNRNAELGNGSPAAALTFGRVELEVLAACQEVTVRNRELLPMLAAALGVPETEVFYTWAFRKCRQRLQLGDGDWVSFFHGLECDLTNRKDGRHLRMDFGPGGRVDTFTAWGVFQFIRNTTHPWSDYRQLKAFLATDGSGALGSGDRTKLDRVWETLEAHGVFEQAAPHLLEFRGAHTTIGADGLRYTRYPPGTPEKIRMDCAVAHRTILSVHGHQLLQLHSLQAGA